MVMTDNDYYKMRFDFPSIQFKEIPPPRKAAVISVPQACFGNACGKAEDIRFMKTLVGPCVALALVGTVKKTSQNRSNFPKVLLAHLDDFGLEDGQKDPCNPSRTQQLINFFQKGLADIHAYVVNGDHNPPLLGRIVQDLESRKIPLEIQVECRLATLAIDLTDGKPVDPRILNGLTEYKPNQNLEAVFNQQVFRREMIIGGAFNLEEGVPSGYIRVDANEPTSRIPPDYLSL